MKILRSALKHGCSPGDIEHAVNRAIGRKGVGHDPPRWLYVDFDGSGRALEIVSVEGDDGVEVVIHAMKLRKKYAPGGGRP